MAPTIEDIHSRLEKLETEFGKKKPEKERKPREKSAYNIFVQEYISEQKKKNTTKSHKELFADAAKEWSSKKK